MENRKIRSRKLNNKVDLTAMVSISFLLIVFFMISRNLLKPNAMYLGLPDNNPICEGFISCGGINENRTMTILLGDNNKIMTYSGLLAYPTEKPKQVKYGKDGIRKEIEKINKKVKEYSASIGKPKSGLIVIIKPSNKCNYKNLVDILDEMAIAGIQSYSIVNYITPEETKLLATK